MRRFWFISCSHFLLHLRTSRFAVDLTQLLSPQGKEEEGGLEVHTGAASPGGLLRLCISVLLPRGAVPQAVQAAWLVLTLTREKWISILCSARGFLSIFSLGS